MSVVIRVTLNGCPLLISDILISSEEDSSNGLVVPTIGSINQIFPKGSGYVPTTVTQKSCTIGDNLLIGWADSRLAAKTILQEIAHLNCKSPFTFETLNSYFTRIDPTVLNLGVSFVGFVADEKKKVINSFSYNSQQLVTRHLGTINIIGSGDLQTTDLLRHFDILPPQFRGSAAKHEAAFGTGLSIAGSLLALELTNGITLSSYFGAGYEIATWVGGKFVKLPEVTYLFWRAEVHQSSRRYYLHQMVKYAYVNDFLMIRCIDKFSTEGSINTVNNDAIHVVPPLLRPLSEFSIQTPRPSMNSPRICNYVIAQKEAGRFDIYGNVRQVGPKSVSPIIVEEEGDLIKIQLRREDTDALFKEADQVLFVKQSMVFEVFGGNTLHLDSEDLSQKGSLLFPGLGFPYDVDGYTCIPMNRMLAYRRLPIRFSRAWSTRNRLTLEQIQQHMRKILLKNEVAGSMVSKKTRRPTIWRQMNNKGSVTQEAVFDGTKIIYTRLGCTVVLDCKEIPENHRFTCVFEWDESLIGIWVSWVNHDGVKEYHVTA